MSKGIKKIVGLVVLVVVLVTTAGTSAQAAKEVKWPYGTYKCTTTGCKDYRIYWEFGDGKNGYDEFVYFYSTRNPSLKDFYAMKRIAKNTYRTKVSKTDGRKFYHQIKVSKNSLVYKMVWGKDVFKYNYKIQKRLSQYVG